MGDLERAEGKENRDKGGRKREERGMLHIIKMSKYQNIEISPSRFFFFQRARRLPG
jgi:hypothetical protein